MKKIIIKKKKVLLFLLLIFIFNSGLMVIDSEDMNYLDDSNLTYDVYTVKKGDTLWTISDRYEYNNKMNFVMEIEKLNNITSYELKPGYKIAIPIYENK
ncbi:LysM peptidoglycan-binding domain-containing protein [Peptoniphilus rhinitidis]|jgi:peptidoglycan-binding lysM|uniref:LysM peptidoglycan-binding domain-containing protein n=1 Tax=Peptoniphilus rhinitidis TaxID=1175452 RepID=UPI000287BBAC|nr:LysM peptidoglycan-binding domain-containing protein [Peptoniphilus rhinitidis]MDU1043499.1 LysM peptidoglycan-binding domain-containing protein [Peptoniphilus rhinitidis]MDU2110278.1 LysM peptidoglycan-binding domain-containing protein [Peptoniphilus lacydonensis]MDU3751791.1 LysM peptidoglycan-binding domain-containing protein [Peptoniphilus rhinitidis]